MALRPDILSHAGEFFAGNFISLFAGGGGIDLGLRILAPRARCVCYVEREVPAAEILAARIADGALHDAPVWSDVQTFDGRPWRGLVDGIVGGFPCQDLSVAGKRAGIQRGNRSGLFYEYARLIREIQPRWVAIENVRAVLAFPAGGVVLGELASLGFDAVWGPLEAADVGAAHERHRKFILAYRGGLRPEQLSGLQRDERVRTGDRGKGMEWMQPGSIFERLREPQADCIECCGIGNFYGRDEDDDWINCDSCGGCGHFVVADAGYESMWRCAVCGEAHGGRACAEAAGSGVKLEQSYRDGRGDTGSQLSAIARSHWANDGLCGSTGDGLGAGLFAPGPGSRRWQALLVRYPWLRPALSQAEAESPVCRVADAVATVLDGRVDALRACGNGVVPLQFAAAFAELAWRAAGGE